MRLWHKDLIPYLPDLQLKGQWRECALIADALAKNGTPNHLLVNRVTEYSIWHLDEYFLILVKEMKKRGFGFKKNSIHNFIHNLGVYNRDFRNNENYLCLNDADLFCGWHDYKYLRICMSNLAEKHIYGIGKSRITDEEWQRLLDGYKNITGEEYKI